MSEVPTVTLNDGNEIPQLGFGIWQVPPEDTAEAVAKALDVGYRQIDTAEMYGNEQGVAEGLREAGVDRDEVFITSKLNNGYHEPDEARRAIETTLEKLTTRHVDLFLIHWPLPTRYGGDFVQTWKALESFKAEGMARSIGVSNFQTHHLDVLQEHCEVTPAVNQIELHPYLLNHAVDSYGVSLDIVTEAWSPLASGEVIDEPAIAPIAERVGKTISQVVLRWHIQKGNVIFPKSVTPERIEENFEIFDFELSDEDIAAIDALDKGEDGRTGPHPDKFDYVPG
jgi:2,5-diketo-D-gluconate reductase A